MDERASVREVRDVGGDINDTFAYDFFGNTLTSAPGSPADQRLRYDTRTWIKVNTAAQEFNFAFGGRLYLPRLGLPLVAVTREAPKTVPNWPTALRGNPTREQIDSGAARLLQQRGNGPPPPHFPGTDVVVRPDELEKTKKATACNEMLYYVIRVSIEQVIEQSPGGPPIDHGINVPIPDDVWSEILPAGAAAPPAFEYEERTLLERCWSGCEEYGPPSVVIIQRKTDVIVLDLGGVTLSYHYLKLVFHEIWPCYPF